MSKKWMIVLIPIGAVACVYLGGETVKLLWNWLAPALFGWKAITFWQGFGLLILCRILFGNWSSGDKGGHRKENKRWHWQRMSPEEQEMFKEWTRTRPGGAGLGAHGSGEPA